MAEIPEGKSGQAAPSPVASGAVASQSPEGQAAAKAINTGRRRIVWALIWGYLGVNFLMFLRFFFPRALYEPNTVFKDKDKNHVVFNLRDLKALLNGKFIRIVTQFEVREDPVEPGSEAKIMIYKAKMIEFSKDLKRLIKK